MRQLCFLVTLAGASLAGCDSAGFGGGGAKATAPAATPQKTADAAPQDTSPKPAAKPGVKATKPQAPATDHLGSPASGQPPPGPDSGTDSSSQATAAAPGTPAPPVGPGSDLTLTINDKDSKLDVFQVRNAVSQQWIPLTWQAGTQTIPGACSPKSKTTLSLAMHSRASFFDGPMQYQTGGCNAPLTPQGPSAVSVGIDPSCSGNPKASFTLACSGSSALEVVP